MAIAATNCNGKNEHAQYCITISHLFTPLDDF